MLSDPIVEEIRKIRLQIESECENDFDKIFAKAIQIQANYKSRIGSKPSVKTKPVQKVHQVA